MTAAITPTGFLDNRYSNFSQSNRSVVGDKPRFKVGYVTGDDTTNNGYILTVDCFKEFGISKILAVEGFIHTTADSIIVEEAPTTTVEREILNITVGGSTGAKQRFYVVYGI